MERDPELMRESGKINKRIEAERKTDITDFKTKRDRLEN